MANPLTPPYHALTAHIGFYITLGMTATVVAATIFCIYGYIRIRRSIRQGLEQAHASSIELASYPEVPPPPPPPPLTRTPTPPGSEMTQP
jgi:hypothetical protein